MNDLFKRMLSLGFGITAVSKEKIETLVNEWVQKGEVNSAESKELVKRLVERGEEEQRELKRVIREQLQKLLIELQVATTDDIERLEKRIAKLEDSHS